MISIQTKYIPATNTKGSRIKAYTERGLSVTISYPHEFSHERPHYEAVKALVKKHNLDWPIDNMCFGSSADGKGYVFCFKSSEIAA